MIKFTVPGSPVGKMRPRTISRGGRTWSFTPAKTVNYEKSIAVAAIPVKPKVLLTGPVSMVVRIYRDIPKSFSKAKRAAAIAEELLPINKPDSSNVVKSVEDALNGIIYVDDSQICDHIIRKRYAEQPRVEVIVEVLNV